MDLARNERYRQENLKDRLRYYILQGEYLRKLQEMYKESNIINQNLQIAYQQYHKNRYTMRKDRADQKSLLDRIEFLQKQQKDIQQDISSTLVQLEKLENKNGN